MKTPPADAQTGLAFLAMCIVGVLAGLFVFFKIPADNKELLTFALGALAGALTVGGVNKAQTNQSPASPPVAPQDPQP